VKNIKTGGAAMYISRMEKYKKKNRIPLKKAILTSTMVFTALFSTSVVYADMDITDSLTEWYSDRLSEVEAYLVSSVETEANNQKAELLKRVREQTEQSVIELKEYADQKENEINSRIEEKANETADMIDSKLKEDVEKTKELIDEAADAGIADKEPKKEEKSEMKNKKEETESKDTPTEKSIEETPPVNSVEESPAETSAEDLTTSTP
jgi:hypothetical protein